MPHNSNSTTSAAPPGGINSWLAKGVVGRLLTGWPLGVAALAACWIQLFNELRREWEINPQYNYGYVVPLLGVMLVWRRWPERPPAEKGSSILIYFFALCLGLLLFPVALVREANPEWRLLYWFHALLVLVLSFCLLYRAGGWIWVRFFASPLIFMLVTVPWPMELEQGIIQSLMRLVAALTIQVVGWMGIPAVQHGNLIEVGAGVVGINEACSGIRSLQSGLMLSLFFGEMYRFSNRRRIALVGASMICVLLANVGRTTFLTWVVANEGVKRMEALHDTVGLLVMLFVLPSLFLLAHWMRPWTSDVTNRIPNPSPVGQSMPRWVAISVFAWISLGEIGTEFWYRCHEQSLIASQRWSVAWPAQERQFERTSVPEQSLVILRCSNSDSAKWKDDEDNQWSGFFLRWDAGKNSAQLAKGHRPEICFPAAGAKLVDSCGIITANADGLDLPFKYQTFQAGDHLLHVFFCLWSDRVSPQMNALSVASPWGDRMHSVLVGERNLGQQVFEIVINGPESSDRAIALFKQELPHLVHRD